MALINFPVSPSVNQTFTLGSKTWIWNGYAWDLQLVNVAPIYAAANSSGAFANAAFSKANTSVQLTAASQTITGNITVNGALTVTGNVSISGNVNQITGNSGQFFGNTAGFGALYAGIATGYLVEPQTVFQISSNFNGYSGLNMQNINNGSNSSSDYFITADNGTVNDGFLDLGFASSTYNYPGYTLIKPNDGYWIVAGNTTTGGGNAIISTTYTNDIIFAQNGTNVENEVARFKYNTGLVFKSKGITFADGTTQNTAAAPYGYSNAAYSQANNISSYANAQIAIIAGVDATQNNNITSAQSFANASYTAQNTTAGFANAAFIQANNISSYANAQILVIAGVDATQNTNITSAQSFANGAFATANTKLSASGFTNNGVMYANGSGYVVNGSALTFDGTNFNVGFGGVGKIQIGTASSGTFQTAFYASNGVDTDFQIRFKTGITDIGTSTSTPLTFSYGGSEQMRLTSTGLGIGTSSPSYKLVVSNAGAAGFEFDPANNIMQTYNRSGSAYTAMNLLASSINFKTGSSPVTTMALDTSGNLSVTGSVTVNTSSIIASTTFTTTTTTSNQIIYSIPTATYRSVKLMVQMTSGTSYQVTELLIIHDGTNAFMTQYGDVATTGTSLGTFDSSITSGNLNLLFTPTNASTTVKLSSSLIVL